MGVSLDGQTPADPSRPEGILEMIQGAISGAGGIGPAFLHGLAGLVTGVVGGVVGAVQGVIGLIGSLFTSSSRDMAAVDQARVDGENAIVQNMSASLEHLDEIQQVGGAYSDYPAWRINWGEDTPHPLPLTDAFPLASGTSWTPRNRPLENLGDSWSSTDENRGYLARGGGTLELQESGLWMIYFQAALLQGGLASYRPADVWCYVTGSNVWVPVGAPTGTHMDAYHRNTGTKANWQWTGPNGIHTFGRAGQYLGERDTNQGGGNTVSGYFMCYLDSPGWFVHTSCSGYWHYGGAASTFVFATKVNSETLRQDIDALKDTIADSLPGQHTEKLLDEGAIAAMVAEADGIEVPPIEEPNE